MKKVIILRKIQKTMNTFAPPFLNYFSLNLDIKKRVVMITTRNKLQKQSFPDILRSSSIFNKNSSKFFIQ